MNVWQQINNLMQALDNMQLLLIQIYSQVVQLATFEPAMSRSEYIEEYFQILEDLDVLKLDLLQLANEGDGLIEGMTIEELALSEAEIGALEAMVETTADWIGEGIWMIEEMLWFLLDNRHQLRETAFA